MPKPKKKNLIAKLEIFRGLENMVDIPSNIIQSCINGSKFSKDFFDSLDQESREKIERLIESYKRRVKEQDIDSKDADSEMGKDLSFLNSLELRKMDWKVMAQTIFQTDLDKALVSNTLRVSPENLLFMNITSFKGVSKNVWKNSTSSSKITKKSSGG